MKVPCAALVFALCGAALAAPISSTAAPASVQVAFLQGEQVVYVQRNGSTPRDAARALLAAPSAAERSREITTQVPAGTALRSISLSGRVATVDVSQRFVAVLARGFEIDLARAIARRLGVARVRFFNEALFSALLRAGRKDWDVALAQISITPQRAARIDFSIPYLRADQGVLVRRGLPATPRTIAALRRLQLCAERASTGGQVAVSTGRWSAGSSRASSTGSRSRGAASCARRSMPRSRSCGPTGRSSVCANAGSGRTRRHWG